MPLWISFTLMAAFMQAVRTACQKTLAARTCPAGATLARALFAMPLAWAYGATLWSLSPQPEALTFSASFYGYAIFAAAAQIIATLLMVSLFQQRNYATGIIYAKTEAIMVALLGLLLFNDSLSALGWLGVVIGSIGILLLSPRSEGGFRLRSVLSVTTAMGLSSGLGFALTSLAIRQAGIGLGDQFILNAALTLAAVITFQTLLLGGYMLLKTPAALRRLLSQWPLAALVGLTSMLGSLGWFTAMVLENPALVKTLGQIEFLFALLFSHKLFKERLSRRELSGMMLILLSVVCVLQAY